MNAELIFFGKRVDMAQRHRRRVLVVTIYAALALLMICLWRLTHWHGTGIWLFWAVMLACRLFLGGYYSGGLIKPFREGNRDRAERAPSLLALKLNVYRPVPGEGEAYRNDERELRQRDKAHYIAYQIMGGALAGVWLLTAFRDSPQPFSWFTMPCDELYCGLTMIGLTLFLTLPQVILLWTEADMEDEA